ncbi:SAVED domain-containing protein [Micromonospora sp. MED01]|uniref:SAVED domain-containing protein n=1 Tax=Micromonospora alfalfae TaxID=2911212 RepID=UPI001EE82442|nr:SAVED domain-containing protein [Micromonospora alfalfae]MCG5464850.1 SAVED domain-containing protein [Micromonospora alfalfae]
MSALAEAPRPRSCGWPEPDRRTGRGVRRRLGARPRTRIVEAVRRTRAPRLHLFFAAPAGATLMLGHHWNLLPPTVVYEHLGTTYAPAMTIS